MDSQDAIIETFGAALSLFPEKYFSNGEPNYEAIAKLAIEINEKFPAFAQKARQELRSSS